THGLGSLGRPFDATEVPGPGEAVNWPPNGGAAGERELVELAPGTELHRAGKPTGGYFSPQDTPIPQRAMAPVYDENGERVEHIPEEHFYEVGPTGLKMNQSTIAPAFDEPGGGAQLQSPVTSGAKYGANAEQLVKGGQLVETQANFA